MKSPELEPQPKGNGEPWKGLEQERGKVRLRVRKPPLTGAGAERSEGSSWKSNLASPLTGPCTFPAGFQILCENQSSIFLMVPISMCVRAGSGRAQLPRRAASSRRWGRPAAGGGGEGPPPGPPALPLWTQSSAPPSQEQRLSGVSKLHPQPPRFRIPQVTQTL